MRKKAVVAGYRTVVPWLQGLFTLNQDSNQFGNQIAQCKYECKSNAHWSHLHWFQVATPQLCCYHGALPFRLFTSASQPASHHIASRLKQTRWTQRVSQRSTLTVGSRLERECHALFVPQAQSAIAWSSSIQIETTSGSRLGECAFSANMPLVAAAHAETTDQRLPRPTTVPLLHSVYSVCPRLTQ